MSVSTSKIVDYCNSYLAADQFKDYCPNGLQVAGSEQVKKIVSGVTACQALLDRAVQAQADLVLVHHGYFWRGESETITGIKGNRIKTLLVNDINLLAYHLPLDAHAEVGNNVQLAKLMNWRISEGMDGEVGKAIVLLGETQTAVSGAALAQQLSSTLNREPLFIKGHDRDIKKIAWCTGAAQSYIEQVAALNVDAFVSGEISEQTVHLARELKINYFAAGHHATESYGVQALGEHLASKFGIEHEFIDIANPV